MKALVVVLLTLAVSASAADPIRFSDSTVIENRHQGTKVVTTTATNEGDRARAVTVTSGGVVYTAGELGPGESAKVTVVEGRGKPVVLFEREE